MPEPNNTRTAATGAKRIIGYRVKIALGMGDGLFTPGQA
jgi:hypothetical protein